MLILARTNNDEIVDCSGAPSDVAEYFGSEDPTLTAGELVVVGKAAEQIHLDGYHTSKAWVARSSKAYQSTLMGVVSTAPAVAYGDEIFAPSENPRPIALSGRVPVKGKHRKWSYYARRLLNSFFYAWCGHESYKSWAGDRSGFRKL
ncbi:hypothetical protein IPM19_00045 [bacterium]|nr:MAG: hypothetical protein IPM19_00045 [bacterium]